MDYLIIDLPPGTADELVSKMQLLHDLDGIIMITIPSDITQHVVRKAINMVRSMDIPIVGLIENISGFICPNCGKTYDILGRGGGKLLSEEYHINFLGKIPIDPTIAEKSDLGKSILFENSNTKGCESMSSIIDKIIKIIE